MPTGRLRCIDYSDAHHPVLWIISPNAWYKVAGSGWWDFVLPHPIYASIFEPSRKTFALACLVTRCLQTRCGMKRCVTVWYGIVWYGMVRYDNGMVTVRYRTVGWRAVRFHVLIAHAPYSYRCWSFAGFMHLFV